MLKSTYDIDQANIARIDSVSKAAEEQLERFNQTSTDVYNQMRENLTEMQVPAETAFELEVYEPEGLPTIINENKQIETAEKTAVFSLNLRGKLVIGITASILVLFSILLIYNAISISVYNNQIATSQQELVIEQEKYNALMAQLEILANDPANSAEGMGMKPNIPNVNLGGVTNGSTVSHSVPTNWFDALCNFVASIFGG